MRTKSTNAVGQEKIHVPAQAESKFNFASSFCSVQALKVLDEVHHIGEDILLYKDCKYKHSSLLKTPSQTHPEVMFYHLSGDPITQSSGYIKLTVIPMCKRNITWLLNSHTKESSTLWFYGAWSLVVRMCLMALLHWEDADH